MSSYTSNSLLILLFNSNGLKNHSNELQLVLQEKRIDIALISETHFTKYSHIAIPGYHLLKTNHPDNSAHGGAAIYIKSSLSFQSLPNFCQPHLQSCAILLHLNNIPTTLAAIYSPPRHNIYIQNYIDYFSSLSQNFIIGGDFNAKHQSWGCRTNNPRGMVLYNFINLKGYTILAPPGPTYWPTSLRKKPDILDIFVSKSPRNLFFTTANLLEPCSDHSAVLLTVSACPPIRPSLPKLFLHSTDRLKFHDLVDKNINLKVSLKSPQEIEEAINNLTNVIQSAAWASGSTKIQYPNAAPSVPEHIRILISNKRRARAVYQRSRLPSHKRIYNNLSNSLKKILAKHKNQSFENHLSNLSPNNGSLWAATKNFLKYKHPLVPIINPHGGFASTDVEKAELFKEHLTGTFTPHPDIQIPSHTDVVNRLLDTPLPIFPAVKHFSPGDVKFAIQKYSLKKSPGFDLITAEVARSLPKRAIVLLTVIYNACLRLSYFPMLWKFSVTILVPKPNKPPDISSSYRPISLLPFFSKILERLILKRILPYISDNSILPNTQFGFRSSHSSIHQLHRLVDAISFSLEKKKYCSCVFLDISQAFDRVWHEGLLYKIKPIFHPTYYLLIKSYLTDRYFQVRVGTSFSGLAKISAGVPQGGILSPLLYNIYAADQPTSPYTTVAEFADDKAIISIHDNPHIASLNLQLHLDLMADWYKKWRIKVNQSKSLHTTFTLRLPPCPMVSLDNIQIPSSQSAKYLGLTIDRRLTWSHHIKIKRLALNARLRILKTLITKNKHTPLNTKLLIYKSLFKPMWTYGLQLWGNAKKSNTNKIQTFQNNILRKITNSPPYISNLTLHTDLKIKTVHEEAVTFYKRLNI